MEAGAVETKVATTTLEMAGARTVMEQRVATAKRARTTARATTPLSRPIRFLLRYLPSVLLLLLPLGLSITSFVQAQHAMNDDIYGESCEPYYAAHDYGAIFVSSLMGGIVLMGVLQLVSAVGTARRPMTREEEWERMHEPPTRTQRCAQWLGCLCIAGVIVALTVEWTLVGLARASLPDVEPVCDPDNDTVGGFAALGFFVGGLAMLVFMSIVMPLDS